MKEQIEEKNIENQTSFWYRAQEFILKNQKILIICGSAIVVIAGFICLRSFVLTPNEQQKTAEDSYYAENYLNEAQLYFERALSSYTPEEQTEAYNKAQESMKKALDGDGQHAGFKKLHSKHSGGLTHSTPALANTCLYYAGIASLRLGKYDEAIKYLEDYNAEDYYTSSIKLMVLADAYVEKGNNKKAVELYEKAAETNPNDMTSAFALYKAGMCCLALNDNATALKHFNTIKEKYPNSVEYPQIDYFIGIAEAK